jgi:mannose/fructose/N-acetylgalactosamine-specific phosphotransferase system component IIB
MPIILYRIDERLIHGQVVVGWGNSLRLDRIILANDKVAKNPWERELCLACVPPEIKATIHSVDEVVNLILQDGFKSQDTVRQVHRSERSRRTEFVKEKMILLVDSPFDILRMVEMGVQIDWVNVGGLHSKRGRKKILPYLYLSTEEISAFKKLFLLGIRCECRDVPLAEKKDLSILLEKLRL